MSGKPLLNVGLNNKVHDVSSNGKLSVNNGKSDAKLASTSSSLAGRQDEVQRLLDSRQSQAGQMGKMLLVIALPVIALISFSVVNLTRASQVRATVNVAQKAITAFFQVDNIVTRFQIERGTTATYLSSGGANLDAYDRVLAFRQISDTMIDRLTTWPEKGLRVIGDVFTTKKEFLEHLNRYRSTILYNTTTNLTFEENIIFYTNIDLALMQWATAVVELPDRGNMWPLLVAAVAMMRASDFIGIQRALGATFFTLCRFSDENQLWFTRLEGGTQALLGMAFSYHSQSRDSYALNYKGTALQKEIDSKRRNMQDSGYYERCKNFTEAERYFSSHAWFHNLTQYMTTVKDIRNSLSIDIKALLSDITFTQETEVTIYSIVVAFVTMASLFLTFWYSANIHKMTAKITNYAKRISSKSAELAAEKKRSETLLYQMLPRSVAEQLKVNKEVNAEYHGHVTVMFSDICGFTTLSAKSTPLQVVDLLNLLYSVFDASIDRYVVYKVETIGDAYMVVSGLPKPLTHHAVEISHLALELMSAINDVTIPHLPDEKLRMRLGIHSGPCVAGVVGLKMPRYCLFGDTISTASLMESSGVPTKIQISDITKQLLDLHGGFRIEARGKMEIKAKEDMMTHFLNGCSIPCQHNLAPTNIRHTLKGPTKLRFSDYPDD